MTTEKMNNRKIIQIEIPEVIWDAQTSIFNTRPIFRTWMESIQEAVNKTAEVYKKSK